MFRMIDANFSIVKLRSLDYCLNNQKRKQQTFKD